MTTALAAPDAVLAGAIRRGAGINAYKCYQCKRCTAGCPVAGYAGLHPAQIVRAVQLGDLDSIMADKFIWLCTGCQTCSTRCPQEIDVAGIMDELRILAYEHDLVRKDAPFAGILKYNADSFKRWGRMYELELLARDKLTRPSSMTDDLVLGVKMVAKGKIGFLPSTGGDRAQMKRMVEAAERIERQRRTGGASPPAAESPDAPPSGGEGGRS
jgi:heterodisulfide reductase subunit C